MLKTHSCEELRKEHIGQEITLAGWVNNYRDHGGVVFLDLRDRAGITQVVCNPEMSAQAHDEAAKARSEYVIQARGTVRARPDDSINPDLPTGEIEVLADEIVTLNAAETPPFYINRDNDVEEILRLEYRYLDLRRPRMQRNIIMRHEIIKFIRDWLSERGFLEIETPILIKSTPEGARDYLVPSRVHPGQFYALPQSPQQLKQLLMVAGFEKYFQIARCFRDEDLRADRQPEFTQLDLEMSFVEQEDILQLTENLFIGLVERIGTKKIQQKPFPRFTYAEAMAKYGSDKPDIRFGMEFVDLTDLFTESEFGVFRGTVDKGGQIKAIRVPGGAELPRAQLDKIVQTAKDYGAKGLIWVVYKAGEMKAPILKFLSDAEKTGITERTGAEQGDLLLIVADEPDFVASILGQLRLDMGDRLGLRDDEVMAFAWVVEFPLLEWNDEGQRWTAKHHPFTSAMDRDWHLLETDPGKVRAKAYDIVANGWELGGGSIRIHERYRQEQMFKALQISPELAEAQFGHLLRAFQYGAPPHGGIAPGIDRIAAMLANEKNIRSVIAFPKTAKASCLMTHAPSDVSPTQLRELHLKLDL